MPEKKEILLGTNAALVGDESSKGKGKALSDGHAVVRGGPPMPLKEARLLTRRRPVPENKEQKGQPVEKGKDEAVPTSKFSRDGDA